MGLNATEAFVLRTYKLGEADKIAVLLTRRAGLLRGVARGARKMRNRFGAGLELFTHIALDYHEIEGRELVSCRQVEIVHSYFHLAGDAATVATLDYLSGLIVEFTPPHQADEHLFRMVKACLDAIETNPGKLSALALYFEIWLLKLSGFLPDVRHCTVCRQTLGRFPSYLGVDSSLQCSDCAQGSSGLKLSSAALTLISEALRTPPAKWLSTQGEFVAEAAQESSRITRLLIAHALERSPNARQAYNPLQNGKNIA